MKDYLKDNGFGEEWDEKRLYEKIRARSGIKEFLKNKKTNRDFIITKEQVPTF